jgi:CDP-glycerol glycerophosphotransferase (TagB/SpsB family)
MNYLGDDDMKDNLTNILRERPIFYDAFSGKLEKLFRIGEHYFLSFLRNERLINVYQSGSRIIMKMILKKKIVNVFINHGWGTKKSPGNREILNKKARNYWRLLRKYTDYVICYSDFDFTYFMRHELLDDLPFPKFVPLGHPRSDFLVKNTNNKLLILHERRKLGIPENAKVILFVPTHRDSNILKNDYDKNILDLFMTELSKIDSYLHEHDCFVLFRPHYFVDIKNHSAFRNIRIVGFNEYRDPRILMLISDALITDYSSIFVDFLLLQRPIIFYQPDLEYFQEVRGLVIDPKNPVHMPGPKINKLREILDIDDSDFSKYDLKASRAFFHKYHDAKSTERLGDFLLKLFQKGEVEDV